MATISCDVLSKGINISETVQMSHKGALEKLAQETRYYSELETDIFDQMIVYKHLILMLFYHPL